MRYSYIAIFFVIISLLFSSSCIMSQTKPAESHLPNQQGVIKWNKSGPSAKYTAKDYGQYDPELGRAVRGLGKKYALVIGIDAYKNKPLPYAVEDAKEIGSLLNKRYGFEVESLVTPENTTKAAIEDALGRLMEKVSPNDQAIIFFSGHGEPIKHGRKIVGGYLIPVNGEKNRLSTLIPMNYIRFISQSLKSRHALFIIDTCYSGVAGGVISMGGAQDQKMAFLKAKMGTRGRQLMTAGKSGQIAQMHDDLQMSVYSYYLKAGLEGNADQSRDGLITMSEIQSYVEERVAAKTGNRQNPQYRDFKEMGDGEFVFVSREFEEWVESGGTPPPEPDDIPDYRGVIIENRKKWLGWQEKMKEEFAEAREYDRSQYLTPKQKETAWASFLNSFDADNRYTSEDEVMIKKARERVRYWGRMYVEIFITETVPEEETKDVVRLRSEPRELSESDIQAMLEKYNFYSINFGESWHNESGNFQNDFEKSSDGKTVTDRKTGLMWQQSGSDNSMVYEKAKAYIEKLNQEKFAGYDDWRLPTIEELMSLMENKKLNRNLYIDPVFDRKQLWCWSSDKRSFGSAWYANFGYGDVGWSYFSDNSYVRGVQSRTSR
ncbi:MAG: DUF1566 domain-containing protein [Desulfobacteraceae bacterium]|nr:DUF1566 domain-containing protein [Desulfobacteraceae bacterium]